MPTYNKDKICVTKCKQFGGLGTSIFFQLLLLISILLSYLKTANQIQLTPVLSQLILVRVRARTRTHTHVLSVLFPQPFQEYCILGYTLFSLYFNCLTFLIKIWNSERNKHLLLLLSYQQKVPNLLHEIRVKTDCLRGD